MMKTQFGLGVLAMPGILDTLGMIPGVVCVCAVAVITTWSNYIVGIFKLRHPEVYGIDDAGALMFGSIGREVFGVVVCLCESLAFVWEGVFHVVSLTHAPRLDLLYRLGALEYIDRSECCLGPRYLYSCLCGGGCDRLLCCR